MSRLALEMTVVGRADVQTRPRVCCWCEGFDADRLALRDTAPPVRFGMCGDCLEHRLEALEHRDASLSA